MEISKQEARLLLTALDKVSVQGIKVQVMAVALAARLESFINQEDTEVDGDDVSGPSE